MNVKEGQRIIVTIEESFWFGKKGIAVKVTPKEVLVRFDEAVYEFDILPFLHNEIEAIDR